MDLLRGRRRCNRRRCPIYACGRSRLRKGGDAARLSAELEVPALKALPGGPLVDRDRHPRRVEEISDKGPIGRILFNEGFEKGIFRWAPCVVEPFFTVFWRLRRNDTPDTLWFDAVEKSFE